VCGRKDSGLLRGRSERDGNVQDGPAVLRVQGRVRRRRTSGRVGQELDQDQFEQRPTPAAATTAVHHHDGGNDDGGRGHLSVCGRAPAGQQTVSRRMRQRAVRAVLRRRGRRRLLSRRRQQLLRHRARRRRTVGPAAAAATAAAAASRPAAQTTVDQAVHRGHHGSGTAVAQVSGLLSAQPDGRFLRTAVGAGLVHVHVQTRLGVLRQHQNGCPVAGAPDAKAQAPATRADHHNGGHATCAARRTARVPGIVYCPLLVVHLFQ